MGTRQRRFPAWPVSASICGVACFGRAPCGASTFRGRRSPSISAGNSLKPRFQLPVWRAAFSLIRQAKTTITAPASVQPPGQSCQIAASNIRAKTRAENSSGARRAARSMLKASASAKVAPPAKSPLAIKPIQSQASGWTHSAHAKGIMARKSGPEDQKISRAAPCSARSRRLMVRNPA